MRAECTMDEEFVACTNFNAVRLHLYLVFFSPRKVAMLHIVTIFVLLATASCSVWLNLSPFHGFLQDL